MLPSKNTGHWPFFHGMVVSHCRHVSWNTYDLKNCLQRRVCTGYDGMERFGMLVLSFTPPAEQNNRDCDLQRHVST